MKFYPVNALRDEEILLRLDHTCDAQPEKRWVPTYYFDICLLDGTRVGRCDLRIGHNDKTYVGGNIGYRIDAPFRGHRYAAKACALLFQLARKHRLTYVIITCDPSNTASARTCAIAGGRYLETIPIPQDNEMYAEGKRQVMVWRFDLMYIEFLSVAARLNRALGVSPLLFGSLGLERRLGTGLDPDDIDVLLPERYLASDWPQLEALMAELGYRLEDASEHEFEKDGTRIAFAPIESLEPFAGVDPRNIPLIREGGASYLLPELSDYLKVYEASSKDGYRRDVRNKKDQHKIDLIRNAIREAARR